MSDIWLHPLAGQAGGHHCLRSAEAIMEQLAEFPKPDVRQQPRRIENPWDCELIWGHADAYVGKILHIAAGHALGLQNHRQEDETIHPWSGSMRCEYDRGEGRAELTLKPGDPVSIRSGMVHGMVVLTDCDVLEASTPRLENVERLADRHGGR